MGIPCIYGLDQNHGTTYTAGGTFFPQNINVAATFNTELARQAAEITAYETRASSAPWTYSPTLDLGRDPRWPRMWENYGEDALVNAEMGAHFVFTYNFIETRIVHNKITFLVKTSAYVKSQFRHLTYLFVKRHARESFLHFRLYGLVARNSRCGLRHDRSCSQRRQECNDAFHVFNI